MFKKIGYIFLFSATVILLAHNVVPHSHDAEERNEMDLTVSCPHQQDNLLGLLASAFHLDLGNGHLQNLKPAGLGAANILLFFVLAIISFDLRLFIQKKAKNYTFSQTPPLSNPFLLSLNSRRGPPVL